MSNASERFANLSPEKRALLAKRLRTTNGGDASGAMVAEPIAVIGAGCRLPGGCQTPEEFWELLRNGVDAITETPPDRWDVDAFYDPHPATPGKTFVRWGGFLEDIDLFDARFFGISPREATWMDPQQRILLEVAWSALERAGQVRKRLAGSQTGVFMGVCNSDYATLEMQDTSLLEGYLLTGVAHSIVANRLSYLLDLHGPSIAVDTACSSSLVALHLACQSLRLGECDMALAGGVNLLLVPDGTIAFSQWKSLAADGRCKTFDARADGFVRSEGCVVVVLKRLSDALSQSDPILGLIRGTAINQDGLSTGLTAPNVLSQRAVLQQAIRNAGATPDQIDYIEAHGTGTSLGDPIEIEALSEVYGQARVDSTECLVGSVKTNIGHTEAAAGVVGLLKVLLALQHEAIPPHLHFRTLNPNIALEDTALAIPTALRSWSRGEKRRLAAISAFGFGGTNAHMIVEEAPPLPSSQTPSVVNECAYLLPISAASEQSLRDLAHRYSAYLESDSGPELQDICHTASIRRTHHDHRLAVVGNTSAELQQRLQAFLHDDRDGSFVTGINARDRCRTVFVFPGQGSQWPGMGRQLFAQEPVFRTAVEQCAEALRPHLDWSLLDLFTADTPDSEMDRIDCIQTAIFTIQVALAALWRHWGVQPTAVIGHSMGEIAATYVAGALSLEDAARVIARRSRLLRRVSGQGAMAVVALSLEQAQECLAEFTDRVSVAVSNSPQSTVLSGDPTALKEILDRLTQRNVFCRLIKVDVASHSPQMDLLRADLLAELRELTPRAGTVPIYSTVLGQLIDGQTCTAEYWVRNLREPVLFATGIQGLLERGQDLFIELSPHPVLLTAIEQMVQQHGKDSKVLASLHRDADERVALLHTLRTVYVTGQPIAWEQLYATARCVLLPDYPWQRERFWITDLIESRGGTIAQATRQRQRISSNPLLGTRLVSSVEPGTHFWEIDISQETLPYLADYHFREMDLLPTAAYVEMILSAAAELAGQTFPIIERLEVTQALSLLEGQPRTVQMVMRQDTPQTATMKINSCLLVAATPTPKWVHHATATLRFAPPETDHSIPPASILQAIQARCPAVQDGEEVYQALRKFGIDYGPAFRGIAQLWQQQGEALARLALPASVAHTTSYQVHPALLDAALQVSMTMLPDDSAPTQLHDVVLPTSFEQLYVYQSPQRGCWSHAVLRSAVSDQLPELVTDLTVLDEMGQAVIDIRGLRYRRLSEIQNVNLDRLLYQMHWQVAPPIPIAQNGRERSRDTNGCWIVFADGQGVGAQLQRLLQERGTTCVLVTPGPTFEAGETDCYSINPENPNDYTELLATVCGSDRACSGIIHLWSLEIPNFDDTSPEALATAQNQSCGSVIYLTQAIAKVAWSVVPQLWLVTQSAQVIEATDAEHLAVAQAPLWGFGRVLALEHPEYWGGMVDLAPVSDEHAILLLDTIWQADDEDQLAFRDGTRYALRLLPDHLPEQTPPVALDPAGSYLITGGLGGLGLKVARSLVEQGARHLILIGRSVFPPRMQWDDLPSDSPRAQQVATIRGLEAKGATVEVLQADVSDLARMTDVFADISVAHPPLRGIIHAAGVGHPCKVLEITPDDLQTTFQAKVMGTWVLHQLTQKLDLHFMVCFSSGAAVWGSIGMSVYGAANSFMDMLAHARRVRALPTLSINWGRWEELQLVQGETDIAERLFTQIGLEVIPTDQALALLYRLIAADTAQATVAAVNWHMFKPTYEAKRRRMLLEHITLPSQSTSSASNAVDHTLLHQLKHAPPKARLRLLIKHVQVLVSQVLRLDASRPVAPQQGFFQMGMDSIMSVELKQRLEQSLDCTLPSTLAFEHPTVEDVARYLATEVLALELTTPESTDSTFVDAEKGIIRTEIEILSDEEAEALLAAELKQITKGT